jgi:hypothetical protein
MLGIKALDLSRREHVEEQQRSDHDRMSTRQLNFSPDRGQLTFAPTPSS